MRQTRASRSDLIGVAIFSAILAVAAFYATISLLD